MPRSTGGLVLGLAAALLIADYATALEEGRDVATGGDKGYDHVDFSVESSGGKDQGHVDFAVGGTGEGQCEVTGQDHVDFSIDGADSCAADNKGDGHVDFSVDGSGEEADIKEQGHVDFSIDGLDAAAGDDRGDSHVDFSVGGTDAAGGGDRGQGHVNFCVDPGGAYAIEAELLPGESGAEICCCSGERGNGHVDFSVVIHADGRVEVNGEQLALCDPAEGCRVSLGWCPGTGALVVQVADAGGVVLAAQYAMAAAPEEIHVAAADVRFLSVVRQ